MVGHDNDDKPETRILSIQSHVTSGYVGNKAAVFPMQLLGYDVDILNSCFLSNHTGYKKGAPGNRLDGEQLTNILQGMRDNGLLKQVTHLLTGYIGSPSCLTSIVEAIHILRKEATQDVIFVCDPVLGDNGRLYVAKEMVEIYIDKVLRQASILTPNCFELGLLTDSQVTSEKEAFERCDYLHEKHGIGTVVVTGTCFQQPKELVSVLVSSKVDQQHVRFAVDADYINGTFTGSGDLMTALLLAWIQKHPKDLEVACSKAMASVTAVLQRTMLSSEQNGLAPFPELRLIQSQDVILEPPEDLVTVRRGV